MTNHTIQLQQPDDSKKIVRKMQDRDQKQSHGESNGIFCAQLSVSNSFMTRLLGHYIAIGVSYTRDNKYYDAQDPGDGRMGQFTHSITSVHNPAQTTEVRQSDDSVRFSSSDDMQMHGHNTTLYTQPRAKCHSFGRSVFMCDNFYLLGKAIVSQIILLSMLADY